MSAVQTILVAPEDGEIRLDRWFKRHFAGLGHGRLEKLLRTGQIRIDGKRARASTRLLAGQAVRVPPLDEREPLPPLQGRARPVRAADTEELRAAILYKDSHVIVLDKPAGLAVQGGTGTERHLDGMLEALRFEAAEPPRLVHRLDRDTSGVLVLARSAAAAAKLARAFREQQSKKIYWAIVVGVPPLADGRIDLALGKLPGAGGERMAADPEGGKRAVTLYRTLERAGKRASWLELEPLTGRTHQLRAHCLAMGTPILGDGKYAGAAAHLPGESLTRRLHLHARAISLPHPAGGTLEAEAPLPPHMVETWDFLGFSAAKARPRPARRVPSGPRGK